MSPRELAAEAERIARRLAREHPDAKAPEIYRRLADRAVAKAKAAS